MALTINERSEIAFFDVETTRSEQGIVIVEFGAILVSPRKWVELRNYSTLVRPADGYHLFDRCNGITKDNIASAPTFAEIADIIYELLHGRIWAGHNILSFDCARIREAFAEINKPPPQPQRTMDTLHLLTRWFGNRAGDMKMASLATYFGLGKQTHRSLDDVRMNLEVLKCCATVLFLESSLPDIFADNSSISPNAIEFLEPQNISIRSISVTHAPSHRGYAPEILILHKNCPLKLHCRGLKIRFGISDKFVDHAGRPRLNFVVDASPSLCRILQACDDLANELAVDSGSRSEWWPVILDSFNSPTVRLKLPVVEDGDVIRWDTEIYLKESSGTHMIEFSQFDVLYLDSLLIPGNLIDAYFSLDAYDCHQNAGIRLIVERLVIHS